MQVEPLANARVFGLDLVRASAILIVLACHYSINFWPVLFSQPAPQTLQVAGLFGVQLFFSLSGYLIGNILLRIVERGATMELISRFWARRWLRTLPCYYLAIAIAVWANHLAGFSDYQLWQYLTLTQNMLGQHGQFLGVSWSLTIEEWFYFLFPLLLLLTAALTRRHAMLAALGLVVCLSALARHIAWFRFGLEWPSGLRVMVPFQLDSIAYGALAAVFMRGRAPSARWCQVVAMVGVIVFSSIWYIVVNGGASSFFWSNGIFIGTAVSGAFIVVGFAGLQTAATAAARPVEFLSIHSYTLYLVHIEMMGVVAHYRYAAGWPQWTDVITAPLAGLAVAMLMTRLVEVPIMNRRPRQFPTVALGPAAARRATAAAAP